jgi:streptogramin lyase
VAWLAIAVGAGCSIAKASGTVGTLEEFPLVPIEGGELGPIGIDIEGDIWTAQNEGFIGNKVKLERVTPHGVDVGELELEEGHEPEEGLVLRDFASGPEGDMWFTNGEPVHGEYRVGRVTPAMGLKEFAVGAREIEEVPCCEDPKSRGPQAISRGPEGNMWFTDWRSTGGTIGRISPSGHLVPFPSDPELPDAPYGITEGSDGNMWFTDREVKFTDGRSSIGRITPSGEVKEFPVPSRNSEPTAIVLGVDGNIWFSEPGASKVGRISPSGLIDEFSVPSISNAVNALAAAPDGSIWFATAPYSETSEGLGRVSPTGSVSIFSSPFEGGYPAGIAADTEGSIWFTDTNGFFDLPEPDYMFVGRLVTPLMPVNSAAPLISGAAVPGGQLSLTTGSWTREPTTFAYQWQRCNANGTRCEDIPGRELPSYSVTDSDVGSTLRAIVTATNAIGDTSAATASTPVVQSTSSPPPAPVPSLTISPSGTFDSAVRATITWKFRTSRRGTQATQLLVQGLRSSDVVDIACRGRGCKLLGSAAKRTALGSCRAANCSVKISAHSGELDLARALAGRHLRSSALLTITVLAKAGIGRLFQFTVHRFRSPSLSAACLAPGSYSMRVPC